MSVAAVAVKERALLPTPAGTFDGRYGFGCDTTMNPLVELQLNSTTTTYTVSEQITVEASTEHNILARLCDCAPDPSYYCPLGTPTCRVSLENTYRAQTTIVCVARTQDFASRYVLPLAFFLFFFFGILCLCSPKGRYSRGYLRRLLGGWSLERYQRELEAELERRIAQQRSRRERMARNPTRVYYTTTTDMAAGTNPAWPPPPPPVEVEPATAPQCVVLRTQTYQQVNSNNNDSCAICLQVLVQGDRVGKLPCPHIFHVACLKEWMRRRKNHCPLCRQSATTNDVETAASTTVEESNEETLPEEH